MKFLFYSLRALIECIRPLLGPHGSCRFELSCSQFAYMELHDKPFVQAVLSISKRLLSCNPLFRLFSYKL